MTKNITFHNVVEMVRRLKRDEQEEIENILEKTLIEKRRRELLRDCLTSERECREGKIKYTSDMNTLKAMLK